ncbi:MAG: hypothetical protein IH827_08210, partial [Myxococcales bacterium]|nr:hypothetical protein [Myxococcales bacterium]
MCLEDYSRFLNVRRFTINFTQECADTDCVMNATLITENLVRIAAIAVKGWAMIHKSTPLFAVLVLSALAPTAARASFISLGVVDGLKINGISADGSYIVGQYVDANGDKIAMRWDLSGFDPLEDLGELPTGKIESTAHAASSDGSVVVGDSKVEDPNDPSKDVKEAFVWEDGVMTGLGFLEDPTVKFESVATAVSEDGLVVARPVQGYRP